MPEELLKWTEIIFDILYLIVIWTLVSLMIRKRANLSESCRITGVLFIIAFFLLALGDSGHVGFRVVAYFMGGLESNPLLVGAGSLATAVTITLFYMLIAEIWRVRYGKKRGIAWWALIAAGVVRLALMIPAANQWGSAVPPYGWQLARNIPLVVQGLGAALLLLVSGLRGKDKLSIKISLMIFVSYLCYIPVILFYNQLPVIGMLMIPKTIAYVAAAFFAYSLFRRPVKEG